MKNSWKQRWTAGISLAGYVLALAGAVLFHNHAHEAAVSCGAAPTRASHTGSAEAAHGHAACRHDHGGRSAAVETAHSQPAPPCSGSPDHGHHHAPGAPQHDDCAICQFLALKLLPATPPALVTGGEQVAEAVGLFAPTVPHPIPGRPLSRGPPISV